jgi:hypothetical protein
MIFPEMKSVGVKKKRVYTCKLLVLNVVAIEIFCLLISRCHQVRESVGLRGSVGCFLGVISRNHCEIVVCGCPPPSQFARKRGKSPISFGKTLFLPSGLVSLTF